MPLKLSGATSGTITLDTPAAAGSNTLILPAKTGNIITSADTGTVTQGMMGANVAGTGPAFYAPAGGNIAVAHATNTKMSFGAESFDTASCYASDRFTPTIAGYYLLTGCVAYQGGTVSSVCITNIYKNGSSVGEGASVPTTTYASPITTQLVYLDGSTDYVEIYAYQITGSTQTMNGKFFCGFLARAA